MTTGRLNFLTFANVTERDAYWPAASAPVGAMCETLDTGSIWQLTTATGAPKWTPPWNTAWGMISRAVPAVTGPFTGGPVAINNLSLPATTIIANRAYEVTSLVVVGKDGTGGSGILYIMDAAGNVMGTGQSGQTGVSVLANTLVAIYARAMYIAGNNGTVSFKSTMAFASGNGTVQGNQGLMTVSDLGPASYVSP